MELITAQMARFRLAKAEGYPVLDTTVKSGDPVFAPSWDIVMQHKAGTLSDAGYTRVYKQLMQASYRNYRARWDEVVRMPRVCVMCYCPACTEQKPVFCHRLLLVDMYRLVCASQGIAFNYLGELTPGGLVQPVLPGLNT